MKLFDENGVAIPSQDIAYIAFEAMNKLQRENKEKLYKKISDYVNKVNSSPLDFDREQAVAIVMMVEHHDKNLPFK